MKRYLLIILAALVLLAASVLAVLSFSNRKEYVRSQEALAVFEYNGVYYYYCRCHDDGSCQSGAMISLRPSCGKVASDKPIEFDCGEWAVNCP